MTVVQVIGGDSLVSSIIYYIEPTIVKNINSRNKIIIIINAMIINIISYKCFCPGSWYVCITTYVHLKAINNKWQDMDPVKLFLQLS